MPFELVEIDGAAHHSVRSRNGAVRLWPLYQTAELLMARVEMEAGAECAVAAGRLTFFLFVEAGSLSVSVAGSTSTLRARESIALNEGASFATSASLDTPVTRLVLIAGHELLPGVFFNLR